MLLRPHGHNRSNLLKCYETLLLFIKMLNKTLLPNLKRKKKSNDVWIMISLKVLLRFKISHYCSGGKISGAGIWDTDISRLFWVSRLLDFYLLLDSTTRNYDQKSCSFLTYTKVFIWHVYLNLLRFTVVWVQPTSVTCCESMLRLAVAEFWAFFMQFLTCIWAGNFPQTRQPISALQ